jgi:glutamate dehydrogenase
MPFLVDSVAMALTRRGSAIHVFVHPMIKVRRDDEGRLLEFLPWAAEGLAESLIHVEIDRQAEQASLDELAGDLHRVLADVHAAVDDWPAMRERIREIVAELDARPHPVGPDELAEARALLE